MKKFLSLLAGLATFTALASAADEAAAPVLDLTTPPTFGALTKAGLKFPIPRWLAESWDNNSTWNYRKGNGGEVDLEAEPARFALAKADARSEPFDWSSLALEFPIAELAEPGDHYPPVLPFTETSKVSRMEIRGQGKDVPATCARAAAFLKVLGVSDPKLETWISSEMWKNAPQFQADYLELSPKVRFSITVSNPYRPGQAGARPPRTRGGQPGPPPVPQGAPAQPQPESQENPPQALERLVTFYIGLGEWKPAP